MTVPIPVDPASLSSRLPGEARRLEVLAHELRGSRHGGEPAIWAAGEALRCAAVLLRTSAPALSTDQVSALLADAVALARSVVEATKFAIRDSHDARALPDTPRRPPQDMTDAS